MIKRKYGISINCTLVLVLLSWCSWRLLVPFILQFIWWLTLIAMVVNAKAWSQYAYGCGFESWLKHYIFSTNHFLKLVYQAKLFSIAGVTFSARRIPRKTIASGPAPEVVVTGLQVSWNLNFIKLISHIDSVHTVHTVEKELLK